MWVAGTDWAALIAKAEKSRKVSARAETFRKKFPTGSQPVLLACDDGNEYVVKSRHAAPSIIPDQIVGRLAGYARFPVGTVALVDVPKSLIDAEPEMQHMQPGVAHASLWMADCSEQKGFDHFDKPENRPRFAQLALLYGWLGGADHQFVYEDEDPRLVHSVDHNGFFSAWENWDDDDAKNTVPDANIVNTCSLTDDELNEARAICKRVSDQDIATAVATPPDDWGVTAAMRIAAARYAAARRDVIFAAREEATDA
jgi:hypothetical protein